MCYLFQRYGAARILQNLKSKPRNNMVILSVAFQDHIVRNLLHPDFSLSEPLLRRSRKTPGLPRARRTAMSLQVPDGPEEREYVLDPAPAPLTLAQKLGLVASPGEGLTEEEWTWVKERSVLQEESAKPCAICREEFRLQPQVLLSCSHVFHEACLRGFERCSGRKRCPMCRREQYETRVIHDAARLFRHHCAIKIQASWRGYVLQELNDSFVRYCHTDTEAFLIDIDRSLSSSRRVLQQLEGRGVSEPRENDWDRLKNQARGTDCPICLTALCEPGELQHTVLLSCSHLFHQLYFEAFETFAADHRPTCPLRRAAYHKKLI
uniref:Ring finger protein 32 n=1 Tax=Kryptolebias marmoratus TaxID=37003 RepID=A0A3Q3AKY1_KRYMA